MFTRIVQTITASGAQNMATDEALVICKTEPTLRLYNWQVPTISLGRLQKITDVNKIAPIIRRPTGGRAIYHDSTKEITYAMVQPSTNIQETYKKNCQFIINILEKLDIKAQLSRNGDILVNKKKISGNAQMQKEGWSMQHGTLLIEKQQNAEALKITKEQLDKHATAINEYTTISKQEVEKMFGKANKELTEKEKKTTQNLLKKYNSQEWNNQGNIKKGACYLQ